MLLEWRKRSIRGTFYRQQHLIQNLIINSGKWLWCNFVARSLEYSGYLFIKQYNRNWRRPEVKQIDLCDFLLFLSLVCKCKAARKPTKAILKHRDILQGKNSQGKFSDVFISIDFDNDKIVFKVRISSPIQT